MSISQKSNTWIAPLEVFRINQKYRLDYTIDRKYATVTAVVIWDILLNNGLNELCKTEPHNDVYPDDNEIWNCVEKANMDALDPYVNYEIDPNILTLLNLM